MVSGEKALGKMWKVSNEMNLDALGDPGGSARFGGPDKAILYAAASPNCLGALIRR